MGTMTEWPVFSPEARAIHTCPPWRCRCSGFLFSWLRQPTYAQDCSLLDKPVCCSQYWIQEEEEEEEKEDEDDDDVERLVFPFPLVLVAVMNERAGGGGLCPALPSTFQADTSRGKRYTRGLFWFLLLWFMFSMKLHTLLIYVFIVYYGWYHRMMMISPEGGWLMWEGLMMFLLRTPLGCRWSKVRVLIPRHIRFGALWKTRQSRYVREFSRTKNLEES